MADNNGIITSRALQAMMKLDSFMKETLRFHGLGFGKQLTKSPHSKSVPLTQCSILQP